MRRLLYALLILATAAAPVLAQGAKPLVTQSKSLLITTGNTFQTLLPNTQNYNSVTIQNNLTSTDNCFVEVSGLVPAGNTTATNVTTPGGVVMTSAQASILLTPGSSYQRYYPYLPRGPIVVTCATTGDSVYADIQ